MHASRITNEANRLKPLAEEVLSRYPFEVRKITHLATHSNVLYRVDANHGRQMVLRVGSPTSNSRSNIQYEVDWLAALNKDTDLDLVSPIPTAGGRMVSDVYDPDADVARHCVLFTWVPGEPLAEGAGDVGYRLMGRLLAQLHLHGRTWLPNDPAELRHWNRVFYYDPQLDPVIIFDARYDHVFDAPRRALIEKAIPIAEKVIAEEWSISKPQIVHGDLHEWNVHLVGARMFAFDFEDVMIATPGQDISISLYSSRASDRTPEIRKAFRSGYEEYAPWPGINEVGLDSFHAARQIVLMNYAARTLPEPEAMEYLDTVMPWLRTFVSVYR